MLWDRQEGAQHPFRPWPSSTLLTPVGRHEPSQVDRASTLLHGRRLIHPAVQRERFTHASQVLASAVRVAYLVQAVPVPACSLTGGWREHSCERPSELPVNDELVHQPAAQRFGDDLGSVATHRHQDHTGVVAAGRSARDPLQM